MTEIANKPGDPDRAAEQLLQQGASPASPQTAPAASSGVQEQAGRAPNSEEGHDLPGETRAPMHTRGQSRYLPQASGGIAHQHPPPAFYAGATPPPPAHKQPNAIPPPPTAQQQQEQKRQQQQQYIPQQHQPQPQPQQQQQQRASHHRPQHSLEHPPGYMQNPLLRTAHLTPSHSHSQSEAQIRAKQHRHDLSALGLQGRWVWDPAPGEAGGRYVYTYDDADTDEREEHDVDAEFDADGYGYGYGFGYGGREEDWPVEWMSDMWDFTMGWARTAGEKLVQAEQGIWRWVNSRS